MCLWYDFYQEQIICFHGVEYQFFCSDSKILFYRRNCMFLYIKYCINISDLTYKETMKVFRRQLILRNALVCNSWEDLKWFELNLSVFFFTSEIIIYILFKYDSVMILFKFSIYIIVPNQFVLDLKSDILIFHTGIFNALLI